uniref:Uncharacterized protein n=1 Tax=Guillardia theta TaxID=55529 RepID=A0A7S4UI10_GUITH
MVFVAEAAVTRGGAPQPVRHLLGHVVEVLGAGVEAMHEDVEVRGETLPSLLPMILLHQRHRHQPQPFHLLLAAARLIAQQRPQAFPAPGGRGKETLHAGTSSMSLN